MKRIAIALLSIVIFCTGGIAQVPTITSFSPQSGGVPTRVTIRGSNFSPTPANNVVRFGTALGTPSVSSADSIFVTAPGNATFGPISVTVIGPVNSLTAYSSRAFFTTFGGGGFTASSFVTPTGIGVSSNSQTTVYADLDADGKLDIVLPQNSGQSVRVARNTTTIAGSFSFGSSLDLSTGWIGPRGVAVGDMDGDGKIDVVTACQGAASPGRLSVLRNTSTSGTVSFAGGVNFRDTTDFLYIPYDAAIGDFDKDGKPDVATAGQLSSGYWLHVFRNTSSIGTITTSSFAHPIKVAAGDNARRIRVADFDGDGKVDVVVSTANGATAVLNVYRNTTTGSNITFDGPITLTPATGFSEIAVGDLNGDGKMDIVGSNAPLADGTVSVFQNGSAIGDITFLPPISLALPAYGIQVELGDVDGDAKPDITVMGSNQIHIFRNLSNGATLTTQSFAPRVDLFGFSAQTSANLAIADIDGDTKPEITVAAYGSQAAPVVVMKNRVSSGFTPTPISTGTTADLPGVSFLNRNTGCIAGRGGVVRVTTDGGTTWTPSTTGTTNDINRIRLIGSRGFIFGTGGLICVSTNGGGSWTPFGTGTSESFTGASFTSESAGWAVGTSGTICIYNGTNWTPQPTGTSIEFRSVYAVGTTGYAVGAGGTICRYNGSTWVPQNSGTTTVTFNDVAFFTDQIGYVVGSGGTICKTTNGGTTWADLAPGLGSVNFRSIKLANANLAWAVGDGGLVAQTEDGGVTWTATGLGISEDLLGIEFVEGQGIIVGNGGKGFRFSTTLVSVREVSPVGQIPASFALEQNYPNPFNPSTTIRFSVALEATGMTCLRVYDLLGREVATLVNEHLKPATYEVTFNGTRLTSGTYFYRLQRGSAIETRKMTIIK